MFINYIGMSLGGGAKNQIHEHVNNKLIYPCPRNFWIHPDVRYTYLAFKP